MTVFFNWSVCYWVFVEHDRCVSRWQTVPTPTGQGKDLKVMLLCCSGCFGFFTLSISGEVLFSDLICSPSFIDLGYNMYIQYIYIAQAFLWPLCCTIDSLKFACWILSTLQCVYMYSEQFKSLLHLFEKLKQKGTAHSVIVCPLI